MRQATVHALNALNRAFYPAIADDWTHHRKHAWPGFARVLAAACEGRTQPMRVLDVGAGDGRFAEYLSLHSALPFSYVGVDVATELMARAAARTLQPGCRFVHADIVQEPDWLDALAMPAPTLIVLLGVMHHVPSFALRARVLAKMADALEPGGVLAATFWRVAEDPRFERRVVSWTSYNAHASQPIDEVELEAGDVLLAWGTGSAPPRYCHLADDAEIEALIAASGLAPLDRFRADGRSGALNDYVLLTTRRR